MRGIMIRLKEHQKNNLKISRKHLKQMNVQGLICRHSLISSATMQSVLLLSSQGSRFVDVAMNFLKWISCSGGCLICISWHFLYSIFLWDVWGIMLWDILHYLSLYCME